jgi:hypothetical protein
MKPDRAKSRAEPWKPTVKAPTILVIDDDAEIRYSLSRVLSSRKYQVSEAPSGEQGVAMVKKGPFAGPHLPRHPHDRDERPRGAPAHPLGQSQAAGRPDDGLRHGADGDRGDEVRRLDYVMKPFDPQRVLTLAENALKTHADLRAVGDYKPTINTEDYKEGIVGSARP